MPRINEYPKATGISATDVFVLEKGVEGTTQLASGDMLYNLIDMMGESGLGLRKSVYRGKSLGTSFSQAANIASQGYSGLFLGDYWTISGTRWTIASFEHKPWLGYPHIVVISTAKPSPVPRGNVAYKSSDFRTKVRTAEAGAVAFFGATRCKSYTEELFEDGAQSKYETNGVESLCMYDFVRRVPDAGVKPDSSVDSSMLDIFRVKRSPLVIEQGASLFWMADKTGDNLGAFGRTNGLANLQADPTASGLGYVGKLYVS